MLTSEFGEISFWEFVIIRIVVIWLSDELPTVIFTVVNRKIWKFGIGKLTLDQGVMESQISHIVTLVTDVDALATGPPPCLARRGHRQRCRSSSLECLHARCMIRHRFAQLDGELVSFNTPVTDGLHGGREFELPFLKMLYFRHQEIQFFLGRGHPHRQRRRLEATRFWSGWWWWWQRRKRG